MISGQKRAFEEIAWSAELSVGIEEIDAQHKVLISLLNELHVAIREKKGSNKVAEILDRLIEYTRIHFTLEECLMRMLDYPGYDEHHAHHEKLIAQIHDLQEKVRNGHHISFELLHFLKVWLAKHIQEEDKEYAPFLLSRGVVATYQKRSWLERILHRH